MSSTAKYSELEIGTKIAVNTAKMVTLYHLFGEPDIVLGFVPLYNLQSLEITKSHQELKYRAIGGQFLAHQRGGNYAVRIDAKLPDTNDYIHINSGSELLNVSSLDILTLLQFLHAHGNKTEVDNMSDAIIPGTNAMQYIQGSVDTTTLKNAILDGEVSVKGEYTDVVAEWHRTFSLITKEEIMFDMYIESMIYYRDANSDDPNTINVSILCRKFIAPPEIIAIQNTKIDRLVASIDTVLLKDNITKDGIVKDVIYTKNGQQIKNVGNGYIVNKVEELFEEDNDRVLNLVSRRRVPDNYEIYELIANLTYRLGTLIYDYNTTADSGYRKMAQDSVGAGIDTTKKESIIKYIDLKSGNVDEINFSYFEEQESITLRASEKKLAYGDRMYFEPDFSLGDVGRVKMIYKYYNEYTSTRHKTYYMMQQSYYLINIGGSNYLFQVLPINNGLKVRLWTDVV